MMLSQVTTEKEWMVTHGKGWWPRARRAPGLVLLIVLALVALTACGGSEEAEAGGLRLDEPWARPGLASPGQSTMSHDETDEATDDNSAHGGHGGGGTSAIFLTISNPGNEDDRLVAATTDVAEVVEIHRSTIDASGVMRMEPIDGVTIPAGGKAELKPGAEHIMLIGLTRDLEVGDRFSATLKFERAGEMTIEVEVREP
jgi:copper(I)-binding protein|nr:MAG: copper chaperone PCu(A)C [Sphaerobacter thermophilus]